MTSEDTAADPVATNPGYYRVLFENDRVRVLDYIDGPGDATTPHHHPDSVMVTLTAFSRRLSAHGRLIDLELPAGEAFWLPEQTHSGQNTGSTATHTIFVELKEPAASPQPPAAAAAAPLGPQSG